MIGVVGTLSSLFSMGFADTVKPRQLDSDSQVRVCMVLNGSCKVEWTDYLGSSYPAPRPMTGALEAALVLFPVLSLSGLHQEYTGHTEEKEEMKLELV